VLEWILNFLAWVIFDLVCYGLGRFIIPVVSIGKWKCAPLGIRDGISMGILPTGFFLRRGGEVYATEGATRLCGLLFLIVLFISAGISRIILR
jgi:hypothetical protein